jgi:hypothetical protein
MLEHIREKEIHDFKDFPKLLDFGAKLANQLPCKKWSGLSKAKMYVHNK